MRLPKKSLTIIIITCTIGAVNLGEVFLRNLIFYIVHMGGSDIDIRRYGWDYLLIMIGNIIGKKQLVYKFIRNLREQRNNFNVTISFCDLKRRIFEVLMVIASNTPPNSLSRSTYDRRIPSPKPVKVGLQPK
jgi:hypothetical protein